MSLLQVGGAEWRLMELSGGGWIWMQLSEGGLSWKQVGALFSNTRFGFQHVLTIQTQAKNTANLANAASLEILDSNNAEPFYQSWKQRISNLTKYIAD